MICLNLFIVAIIVCVYVLIFHAHQGRVSGILNSVPVYAVLAEDVGQRGAYREAYQQFLRLRTADGAENNAMVGMTPAAQKRNNLLLLTGVLTTLFMLVGTKCPKHH